MGNAVSSSSRRHGKGSSRSGSSSNGKRVSMDDDSRSSHALAFFDNLCGSVIDGENNHNYSSSNHSSKDKKRDSRSTKNKSSSADSTEDNRHFRSNTHHSSSSASRKYSLSHSSSGRKQPLPPRRPRTSYDDDTESDMAESEVDGMEDEHDNDGNDDDDEGISTNNDDDDEETDADTMVTDVSELTPAAAAAAATTSGPLLTSSSTNSNGGAQHPMTHRHHNAKPLASSFAKKCYFTKAGIGKMTQHYEGLVHNGGPTVLMLASAMKLKGCPTICDEDLRRVEQSFPNLFSRLPDELMLSSGWRRISKYCHFSNRPIPDGVPFFHSKQKIHPNGGYYFLLASAVGMMSPSEVEPLTRDHLVVLETDFPTQCDAAPLPLIQNPTLWTLVTKFCFFSGGPINTDEDVYYQADFGNQTIYMLAFLSPALTPEELYLMDSNSTTTNPTDQNHPIHRSVDAVRDVESVYDLMDRDFDDLKLYHLGPCRALPPHLLQPPSWTKVLPEHFRLIRQLAIERAQAYEEQFGKIHYSTNTANTNAYPQQEQQQQLLHTSSNTHLENSTMVENNHGVYATYMEQHPQVVLPSNNVSSTSQHASAAMQHPYTPQMPFYNITTTDATTNINNGPFVNASKDTVTSPYYTPTYLPYTTPPTTMTMAPSTNGALNLHQPPSPLISSTAVADIYPRPHDEVDGMMDLQQDIEPVDQSEKVSVVSFGGDVDLEAPIRMSTTTATTTTDEIRISAPSSEFRNDEGDITMTSKSYSVNNNNNNNIKRYEDTDRGTISNSSEHTSPQRKNIPETWMNEKNDVRKSNSRYDVDDDNFSYNKKSPANYSTLTSKHLVVDDEVSSIQIGCVIHPSAALEQEVLQSPLLMNQVHSFSETKRRPLIGLKRSPIRKTQSPSHWQNPSEDNDTVRKQDSPNLWQKHIKESDSFLNSTIQEKYDEVIRNGKGPEGTVYPADLKNGAAVIQPKDSYDDSELMRSVSSSLNNDENDESRLYVVSRRDRTMFEDEYSVGRTRVRDITTGNRPVRSASLSSRLRQKPSELALKKPLQESKQVKTKTSSTNNYDSPPPKISSAVKVPMSLKSKNDDAPVVNAKISKVPQETDYSSSKFSNDETSGAVTKYSNPLNDSKVVPSRVLSSYNYVLSGKSPKNTSFEETNITNSVVDLNPSYSKTSPSTLGSRTTRQSPESEPSSRVEDSPIQFSPETASSAEADRTTRRALILKMAKARMQKHKRELSENPVRNHNSNNATPVNLDLD